MQSTTRTTPGQSPVKIYNAVYSSVQVYECMVRGIAVMRRRSDAYVNATQILKVAGIDKGRRTKILEKEILPGKHEIVQGGYGKYQGTWIPLERGRELAMQFGVEPLIAPLFDFQPNPNMFGPSPLTFATTGLTVPSRPLSASSLTGLQAQANSMNGSLAPPPIQPGSALRLLNQGRAQGLFTPSTTTLALLAAVTPSHANGTPLSTQELASLGIPDGGENGDFHALKRTHSQRDDVIPLNMEPIAPLAEPADIHMLDALQLMNGQMDNDEPSLKRQRTESERTPSPINPALIAAITGANGLADEPIADAPPLNSSVELNGVNHVNGHAPIIPPASFEWRVASKPFAGRGLDTSISLKESRRSSIVAHIMGSDNPTPVLDMMRQDLPENPASPSGIDVDVVLDDQGHTALHIAATMGRLHTVQTLIASGADVHRGNFMGETALVRACLSTQCHDSQVFDRVVEMLHDSIRTVDTSLKSVLHHIVSLAGVKGRELAARYYLDAIFTWIANRQQGDFKSIVDLQDEHGDTALNIAARVGNRGMIKILLDVNANRALANKLGLRPANFGVEVEDLGGNARADDVFAPRAALPIPPSKTAEVIGEITSLVQGLSAEFNSDIKSRQDQLDLVQAHLRAATRELSEQRKQVQHWQTKCTEVDQLEHQIRNLDSSLTEEDRFDWTGRTTSSGEDAKTTAGSAFRWRGLVSMLPLPPAVQFSNVDAGLTGDIPIPADNSPEALIRLRRMKMWYERTDNLLNERLQSIQGSNVMKEYQYRKIVSLCCNLPIDQVEKNLDTFLQSFESESQVIDVTRAAAFLQKVRDGGQSGRGF